MPVEIALNTPLADALTTTIQPKLVEVGWADDENVSSLAEYIILMLINEKTQDQIAAELAGELLNLPPEDPSSHEFARWLFEQIESLNAQINGGAAVAAGGDGAGALQADAGDAEMDTDLGATDISDLNVPTGPRSMRNGNGNGNQRGGRDRRMLGQMSKAMDRTSDGALHRVRGGAGINTHSRGPPSGPRGGGMRGGRGNMNRAANIQHGLAAGMGGPGNMMMPGQQPGGMDVYAILEQQNQMMMQLSQQIMNGGPGAGGGHGQRGRGGKSLFNRVQDPHNRQNSRGRGGHGHGHHNNNNNRQEGGGATGGGEGNDVDMGGDKGEPVNPEDTVCKYNLNCTNRECKFAHQSPAAPRGAAVDVNDVCSFGAACKNHKCVGRHPSPATKLAHQSEQDCKFFPNCQNPRCPFKHPSMPLCRNGAGCTTADCKFTHVRTKCKFNPCLNPKCAFAHDEGQHGGFKDKVWTAESGNEHVSDRKFVDDGAAAGGEELVQPEGDGTMHHNSAVSDAEVIV